MKRYKHGLLKMIEHTEGEWVLFDEHNSDYMNRWELNKRAIKILITAQSKNSMDIQKYKVTIFLLSALLIISLVMI
jgi:hypothetical protein